MEPVHLYTKPRRTDRQTYTIESDERMFCSLEQCIDLAECVDGAPSQLDPPLSNLLSKNSGEKNTCSTFQEPASQPANQPTCQLQQPAQPTSCNCSSSSSSSSRKSDGYGMVKCYIDRRRASWLARLASCFKMTPFAMAMACFTQQYHGRCVCIKTDTFLPSYSNASWRE